MSGLKLLQGALVDTGSMPSARRPEKKVAQSNTNRSVQRDQPNHLPHHTIQCHLDERAKVEAVTTNAYSVGHGHLDASNQINP